MNPFKTDHAVRNRSIPLCGSRFFQNALILILFFIAAPSAVGIYPARAAEIQTNCNLHSGACTRSLPEGDITLDVSPKPVKAMQDLVFRVTLTGEAPERALYIDLGMPGMRMGPNRVVLKKISRHVYEGKGVIVRCPSGSRIWQATITVPGGGQTDFIFDVVY